MTNLEYTSRQGKDFVGQHVKAPWMSDSDSSPKNKFMSKWASDLRYFLSPVVPLHMDCFRCSYILPMTPHLAAKIIFSIMKSCIYELINSSKVLRHQLVYPLFSCAQEIVKGVHFPIKILKEMWFIVVTLEVDIR